MHARAYRPSHYNGLGGGSGVAESWPSVRVEHVDSSGAGDAAEVGALLSVRAFLSLGELTPDDVHVQVPHGKIDCNDVLTGVTVQDLELAESCVGGRHRFDGPSSSTAAAPSATPCGRSRATTCSPHGSR
jgi:starch phosphorylase